MVRSGGEEQHFFDVLVPLGREVWHGDPMRFRVASIEKRDGRLGVILVSGAFPKPHPTRGVAPECFWGELTSLVEVGGRLIEPMLFGSRVVLDEEITKAISIGLPRVP